MSEEFTNGAADRLLDRLKEDPSGKLKSLVMMLMESVKQLSMQGIPIDEIAATVTMSWYIGQNPEIENIMQAFANLGVSDENNYN